MEGGGIEKNVEIAANIVITGQQPEPNNFIHFIHPEWIKF